VAESRSGSYRNLSTDLYSIVSAIRIRRVCLTKRRVRLPAGVTAMLVLFETPAGHALFKVLDEGKVRDASVGDVEGEAAITQLVRLKAFSRFADTTAALASATALVESKPSKDLRKFLKKETKEGEEIAVGDAKLGAAIKDKTGLQCLFSSATADIMRGIRSNIDVLLEGQDSGEGTEAGRKAMVLGLAHSLSRYKLKFSPDKVDTMIVQAIGLLDDLDKEINTYAMRLREWYGWHFPEMGKVVADNLAYSRAANLMGMRTNAKSLDFSSCLPEEIEEELKQAAEISMGTEISDEDVMNIRALCHQVESLSEYRMTLFEYLKNRMTAIAPNLTIMVGELVGARLISHAGSLLSLAKYPASTVQILGAEKALFRALKTKHATPKYGLIYHASVVGQAAPKHKGKISRSLASKCSLAIRVDALGDAGEDATVGETGRLAVEARLRQLEGKQEFAISKLGRNGNGAADKTPKYTADVKAGKDFNAAADMLIDEKKPEVVVEADVDSDDEPKAAAPDARAVADAETAEPVTPKKDKKEKKEKKEKKDKIAKKDKSSDKKEKKRKAESNRDTDAEASGMKSDKKEKKRKAESNGDADVEVLEKKKAKKDKKSKRKSSGGDE
jgi:nucleolar protein 58